MKTILTTLAFWGLTLHATEIVWLDVSANLVYKSPALQCGSGSPGESFYLSTELENGTPKRIVLSNHPKRQPFLAIHKSIELTQSQVAQAKFFRAANGKYWLKTLPLSEELLKWVLYVPTLRGGVICRVPKPIRSVTPHDVTYEFNVDDIDEGILISHSQPAELTGTNINGDRYEARLKLTQREINYEAFP